MYSCVDTVGRQHAEDEAKEVEEDENSFIVKFKDLPTVTDRALEAKKYTILWDKTKTPSVGTFYEYRSNQIEFYKEKMKV